MSVNQLRVATAFKSPVRCREIRDDDIEIIADLLVEGFSSRSRDYWIRGLRREQQRAIPEGYPRYGFMLENEDRAVGVVLVFYSHVTGHANDAIICNVGGWYVAPGFRGHAPRLLWAALKEKNVIYTDVTPAVPTWPIVEKLGFQRYCNGLYFAFPRLSFGRRKIGVEIISPKAPPPSDLQPTESELLVDHARYGCLSVVCRAPDREPEPFIFIPFRMRQGRIPLPAMLLVYCRGIDSYKDCASALGMELIKRGKPIAILDSNSAVTGLAGFFTDRRGRKYFRGPSAPPLINLTNTELVLFGP